MKKKLFVGFAAGLFLFGIAEVSSATQLTSISVTGYGTFFNKDAIDDNFIPNETGEWRTNTTYWNGTQVSFVLDYGSNFLIEDALVSVDNNDTYHVDYSTDLTNWNTLFDISSAYGEVGYGMDTMSTVSGDTEYISGIDFAPVTARYISIRAVSGDNSYSIGELQIFGSPSSPVPEPTTMFLFGIGMLGLAGCRIRKKNG